MGDFYELFEDDAEVGCPSARPDADQPRQDIPMAGLSASRPERYLQKLLQAGHRVAICDQVEDPARPRGSSAAR